MKFLEDTLGIKTVTKEHDFTYLPNFILSRYHLEMVLLDSTKTVFVYPKGELESIEKIKRHFDQIKSKEKVEVVIILEKLTYRQRQYLIRERIPFICNKKQIYLPFLGSYLQEKCDAEEINKERISPAAELLLLFFISNGAHELSSSKAALELDLTPMTISRSSTALEQMGFIKCKTVGTQKIMYSECSPKELFEKAKQILLNPVKRIVYVQKERVEGSLLQSGYLALSEYTLLNEPTLKCYASNKIGKWSSDTSEVLYDSENQVAIQLWRYDPSKLSKGVSVDHLSLALSLRDDKDERVQEALEEMLNDVWRKMNDKGDKKF